MVENQEVLEDEIIEEPEIKPEKKSKGQLALEKYRNNLTPEQKQANIEL